MIHGKSTSNGSIHRLWNGYLEALDHTQSLFRLQKTRLRIIFDRNRMVRETGETLFRERRLQHKPLACFLRPHLIEYEIPEAVEDVFSSVHLRSLHDMRMMTDDHFCPRVDSRMSERYLRIIWGRLVFVPRV